MTRKWFSLIIVAILLGIIVGNSSIEPNTLQWWLLIIGGNLFFQAVYTLCEKDKN